MEKYGVKQLCLMVIMLHAFSNIRCLQIEPQCTCSKFHYDEQLLEKMIRTEIKFEELKKTVENYLEQSKNAQNDFTKTVEEKIQSYKDAFDSDSNVTKEILANAKETIDEQLILITERSQSAEVLFRAFTTSNDSFDMGQTILFQNSMYNFGNGFNTATGVFTAPVKGIYIFNSQLCAKNSVTVHLIADDTIVGTGGRFSGSASYFYVSAMVKLKKGSSVAIKGAKYHNMRLCETSEPWSVFSGMLIM